MPILKAGFVTLFQIGAFDTDYARRLFRQSVEFLKGLGIEIVAPQDIVITLEEVKEAIRIFKQEEVEALIIQSGTFAWGFLVAEFAQKTDFPLALWAVREPVTEGGPLKLNSLCSVHMNASILTKLGRNFKFFMAIWTNQISHLY